MIEIGISESVKTRSAEGLQWGDPAELRVLFGERETGDHRSWRISTDRLSDRADRVAVRVLVAADTVRSDLFTVMPTPAEVTRACLPGSGVPSDDDRAADSTDERHLLMCHTASLLRPAFLTRWTDCLSRRDPNFLPFLRDMLERPGHDVTRTAARDIDEPIEPIFRLEAPTPGLVYAVDDSPMMAGNLVDALLAKPFNRPSISTVFETLEPKEKMP